MTIAEIVEAIKSMTILEVADLVKAIEDECGCRRRCSRCCCG